MSTSSFLNLKLKSIKPSPLNPRKTFAGTDFNALVESVKTDGVLQPITVRLVRSTEPSAPHFFEIVMGERRFRAAQIAGLQEMPALIRQGETSDADLVELALIENLHRKNMNAIEEADGFAKMLEMSPRLTQTELAHRLGKVQSYISNAMRLRCLPHEVKELMMTGDDALPRSHAVILVAIADLPECVKLAQKAVCEKLTIKDVEKAVKGIKGAEKAKSKPAFVGMREEKAQPAPITDEKASEPAVPPFQAKCEGEASLVWEISRSPAAVLLCLGGYEVTADLLNAVKTNPAFRKTVYLRAIAKPMAAYEALGGAFK